MPAQMTAETLNALKGWPNMAAVDFHAPFDATVFQSVTRVPAGSVVSLNSSGNFILGVGNTKVMPLFTFYASDDPTVSPPNGGDPSTTRGVYVGLSPTGQCLALPACGAYELVSTNFVADSYAPNTLLTSATSGANAGKLAAGTLWTNTIVGIVSRGIVDNGYGHDALAFWPHVEFSNP